MSALTDPLPMTHVSLTYHQHGAARDAVGALRLGESFVAVTGPEGFGKTVVLDAIIAHLSRHGQRVVRITRARPDPLVVQRAVVEALGITEAEGQAPEESARALRRWLRTASAQSPVLLAIDDAHEMPDDTLRHLWLLASLLTQTRPLLQVVFVGRPEFWQRLTRAGVPALRDSISARVTLGPPGYGPAPDPMALAAARAARFAGEGNAAGQDGRTTGLGMRVVMIAGICIALGVVANLLVGMAGGPDWETIGAPDPGAAPRAPLPFEATPDRAAPAAVAGGVPAGASAPDVAVSITVPAASGPLAAARPAASPLGAAGLGRAPPAFAAPPLPPAVPPPRPPPGLMPGSAAPAPAMAVGALPSPPAPPPAPPAAASDIDAAVPARVVVAYPRSNRRAGARARQIASALRASGLSVAGPVAVPFRLIRLNVTYFTEADRAAAAGVGRKVSDLLGIGAGVTIARRQKPGRAGTVEISVPSAL